MARKQRAEQRRAQQRAEYRRQRDEEERRQRVMVITEFDAGDLVTGQREAVRRQAFTP